MRKQWLHWLNHGICLAWLSLWDKERKGQGRWEQAVGVLTRPNQFSTPDSKLENNMSVCINCGIRYWEIQHLCEGARYNVDKIQRTYGIFFTVSVTGLRRYRARNRMLRWDENYIFLPKCHSQSGLENKEPTEKQLRPNGCKCGHNRYDCSQICSHSYFHKHKFVPRVAIPSCESYSCKRL